MLLTNPVLAQEDRTAQQMQDGAGYLGKQFGQFMRGFSRELGQGGTSEQPRYREARPRYQAPRYEREQQDRRYQDQRRRYKDRPSPSMESRAWQEDRRFSEPAPSTNRRLPRVRQRHYDPWGVTQYGAPPPEAQQWYPWPPSGGGTDWNTPDRGWDQGWNDPYGRWTPDRIVPDHLQGHTPYGASPWDDQATSGHGGPGSWPGGDGQGITPGMWLDPAQGWTTNQSPWRDAWDGGLWNHRGWGNPIGNTRPW
ncbi:hypothetical protein [Magnetococcus sp. PR-3]|uniref:hypothetical protein n=1 Tax=Magnetococcus sp. PR-3 TaxID=3120355 RepID=UPI002FCE4537